MKIIVCNKRGGESLLNRMTNVSLRADSALLKTPKPFFVPDDVGAVRGQAYVVYRIGRLGKSIEKRFAERYVDGMTIGVDFWACDEAIGEMGRNMDGSCVVGEFVGVVSEEIGVGNEKFGMRNEAAVAEAIEVVSRYMSLRQGDLLFAEAVGEEFEARIGERIEASVGGRKVLDCRLK